MIITYIDDSLEKSKTITLLKNQNLQKQKTNKKKIELNLYQGIRIRDISPLLIEKFHFFSKKKIRIFNSYGVEIFEDDLQYVKDKSNLYVTQGENFDQCVGLAQYHQIKVIGRGGFAKVILGQHCFTKQKVAIKIVNTAQISNAHDIDMVFREVEILQSLHHNNIVQIYKCFTILPMKTVFIMEYLEGGELSQLINEQGQLNEKDAFHIFNQIIDAISYCHRVQLVHRDLKIENILFTTKQRNQIKIVDFGIAGLSIKVNIQNINEGSLCYMAPEILTGQSKMIEPFVDIWALGCILFIMLTGQQPFKQSTVEDTINKIINCQYQFPKNIKLSKHVKQLIQQMLDVDPNSRITIQDVQSSAWFSKNNLILKQIQEGQINQDNNDIISEDEVNNDDYNQEQHLKKKEISSVKQSNQKIIAQKEYQKTNNIITKTAHNQTTNVIKSQNQELQIKQIKIPQIHRFNSPQHNNPQFRNSPDQKMQNIDNNFKRSQSPQISHRKIFIAQKQENFNKNQAQTLNNFYQKMPLSKSPFKDNNNQKYTNDHNIFSKTNVLFQQKILPTQQKN